MALEITRRPYRGPLRAVIFDWAGTLLDFGSRAPVLAVQAAFEAVGVGVTTAEAREPMGMAKRAHLQAMLDMPRIAKAWQDKFGQAPGDAAVDSIFATFLNLQQEILLSHAELIPGALEAIDNCRRRGLKIGSSTGYTSELLEPLIQAARGAGLEVDEAVCASDVPIGRPAPWLCFENARRLGVYPMAACVKVDDTTVGVEAGVNAGMWAVGVAATGNLVGLGAEELTRLPQDARHTLVNAARAKLIAAGSHLVVDSIAALPAALETIEAALRRGESP